MGCLWASPRLGSAWSSKPSDEPISEKSAALQIFGDQNGALCRTGLGVVRDEEELHAVRSEDVILADPTDAGGHAAVRIAILAGLRPVRILVHGDPGPGRRRMRVGIDVLPERSHRRLHLCD